MKSNIRRDHRNLLHYKKPSEINDPGGGVKSEET
jgi:hypothetical protein